MDTLVETFLSFRNMMKAFHWKTTSYPRHVASDAFVTQFDALVDRFMEVYIGRYGRQDGESISIQIPSTVVEDVDDLLADLRVVLRDIVPDDRSTDLLNIRDEMIALVNQTIYLFTLS